MENAVGDVINLISKSEIRYEGQLHSINTEENTVSLSNVRIFGTEGRKGNVNEVPPTEQIFEFIVFRGSDIKDLTVYRDGTSPQARDPAIVEVHAPTRGRGGRPAPAAPAAPAVSGGGGGGRGGRGFYDEAPSYSRGSGNNNNRRGGYGGGRYNNNNHHGNNNNRNHHDGYSGGRGSGAGANGGAGGNYRRTFRDSHTGQDFQPAAGGQVERFEGDFDFTKSREDFEKQKNEFEKAKEDAKSHTKAYDKSSFFDTVSCDQKERAPGMKRAEMRKADTETFGPEMVSSMRGFRRGRGGRGGRGRFQAQYGGN